MNQMETSHSTETSGFWEGGEDESHLEEKYSQAVPRNSSPLGSSSAYFPAQDKGGSSKWHSIESFGNYVWVTISGCDWGGKYVSRSRSEGKENVQHLNQTLAVINDLAYIRDLFPTGVLHSFEPGDKVLFKTWKTASPESQPEEMWTDPCDVLLTTARHGEAGRNKTLDSSHQSKESTGGTMDH